MENTKQQLGQFFTKNTDYILSDLGQYVRGKFVIDPFAGAGDLLDWALQNGADRILGLDIDKKCVDNKRIFYNDSLQNPKTYQFVLTNPPYLYQNKMADNSLLVGSQR
ncbi:MAG: class I SAM-dependent methyltransferase [Planctomycetaceae bacterium]|jgi:predicted RNA methylase|nr:class I SAM-dependent methyltransferase [Planctomycetaceae bacterium]